MKLKAWLGYNLYKKLWSVTLGRPYTYGLRDLWHKAEFVWIILLIAVGVWMGHNLDWLEVLKVMGIFTIGYITGHLFWTTKYIPNQQGK